MPSTITHAYIGLDTLDKVHEKPKNLIMQNINNYKVYCQSMDVLYFYHILLLKGNKIQKIGHTFHQENVLDYFKLLINDNKKNKDSELFTFISGLITHYKADSIMHPYINYMANNHPLLKKDGHFILETYLDNYFISERVTKDYMHYNNSEIISQYEEKEIIKKEIEKLFQIFWKEKDMGKKYYQSLKEMLFVFKYLRYDNYGIKKRLYQLIDLLPVHQRKTVYLSYHFPLNHNNDFLNLNHQKWNNIDSLEKKISTKSFLDLFTDVCFEASSIINQLYDYIFENKDINLDYIIGNTSYANGLPIVKKKIIK